MCSKRLMARSFVENGSLEPGLPFFCFSIHELSAEWQTAGVLAARRQQPGANSFFVSPCLRVSVSQW